jgi:hypothetical protein
MPNPKRGEMTLNLGGKTYNCKVTMDGLARIEQACGCGIVKILTKLTDGDLTTTEICSILLPVIKSGGNDVSIKDIQAIVWGAGLADSMRVVGEVLAMSLGTGEESGKDQEAA